MTRDQILSRVRSNLNDSGVTFWNTDDMTDSIQDGYDQVAVNTECIEKMYTLAAVTGRLYYNLYQTITDFVKAKAVYNTNNNRWLEPASIAVLQSYGLEWEKAVGQPSHFCPITFEYTALWPTFVGSQNYTLLYSAQADTLSGTTIPQIPLQFQPILEDYCTADLLEQAEEDTKAQKYWISYAEKEKALRQFMIDRFQERLIVSMGEIRGGLIRG